MLLEIVVAVVGILIVLSFLSIPFTLWEIGISTDRCSQSLSSINEDVRQQKEKLEESLEELTEIKDLLFDIKILLDKHEEQNIKWEPQDCS